MQIAVAYSEPSQQVWLRIEVPEDSTVQQAIERSGILNLFPQIDLAAQKIGIFGKLAKLDAPLQAGDRVEIYSGITADPKTVPRRRMSDEDDDD
ncbi:MAG: RnfH family protein [Betaproteobacteria bacterium]|nr:RnfH family protein [Betaproteobacteria bacterium]